MAVLCYNTKRGYCSGAEVGNILLASKMLGHSNVTTTQAFYVVTDQDELENEISKGV